MNDQQGWSWNSFLHVYGPVYASAAPLARRAGVDPELFKDGLQEIAKAVCRGWRRVPRRQKLIVCALRAARRLERWRRRFVRLGDDDEPEASPPDPDRERQLSLAHEMIHVPDIVPADLRPVIAAIAGSGSQREAAERLGLPLTTFQRRVAALKRWAEAQGVSFFFADGSRDS